MPAAVTHFDLSSPQGPPTQWRGSVRYESQSTAASWDQHSLFVPTALDVDWIYSSGTLP